MSPDAFEQTSFLDGENAQLILTYYQRYLEDPSTVDSSWHHYFAALEDSLSTVTNDAEKPYWVKNETSSPQGASAFNKQAVLDSIRALMLIRVYRVRGHLKAKFDPLDLDERAYHPELDPKNYGFQEADMDRPIYLDKVLGLEMATMREILKILQQTYCENIAVEFMHIQDPEEKAWIQNKFEDRCIEKSVSDEERKKLFEQLLEAETFEQFLNKKHTGAKKFGLDGLETFIPSVHEVIKVSAGLHVNEVVIGMAHRGRLNVLANIMRKSLTTIFSEFLGTYEQPDAMSAGDVKYHQGFSSDQEYEERSVHLSLSSNPSHLEAVDPVVLGKVRAKQEMKKDVKREQVLGILVHGDAAFIGQGIVPECFGMSDLKGYTTGGTIHVVTNNQIGFTTNPTSSRSSPYCTEVAKIVHAPVFHVNADCLESVIFVSRLAAAFRHQFKKDVVIDLVGYRRYGHNEGDDPSFTQPKMYRVIKNHPTALEIYSKELIERNVMNQGAIDAKLEARFQQLSSAYDIAQTSHKVEPDWLKGAWQGLSSEFPTQDPVSTLTIKALQQIGQKLYETNIPGFQLHKRLQRILEGKRAHIEQGSNLDWATAEALAFGSLLQEGFPVRLSGQDCGRGTFSQRHAVYVDQETEKRYIPLNHLSNNQEKFQVYDSPLAEFSVLGFEYGYSSANPHALVIWEAQFGDFANGAQVIFDQFISSAESKWLRMSGLVIMLPHGSEGQGPEHSSARPERYLQLCAEENMQVANCTTPANYFHILRRQLHRTIRKPLILMTPKSLLRHKLAVSSLKDMAKGTHFMRVIPEVDQHIHSKNVKRVLLCAGKVYYDLYQQRLEKKIADVAIIRVEQLYPWPARELQEALKIYPQAEVVWCQEEPENMGAWHFADRRIEDVLGYLKLKHQRPRYVGRPAAASPATGFSKKHEVEQAALVDEALMINVRRK